MGLSRNKVAVSEGAAGSPPFYGERVMRRDRHHVVLRLIDGDDSGNDCCSIFKDQGFLEKIVSATNAEGPPVPIPNTEVKLCSGENTLRETVREDSSMPTSSVEGRVKSSPEIEEKPSETKIRLLSKADFVWLPQLDLNQ